jgi:hypothetical protein
MFIKQKHVIMKKELFQYPDLFEDVQMQHKFFLMEKHLQIA